MTMDRQRTGNWTGDQWAPDETTNGAAVEADGPGKDRLDEDSDRWVKTQWPGDQGEGMPSAVDPDAMPEGDTTISGDRHAPSEQDWAGGRRAGAEGDRPLDR